MGISLRPEHLKRYTQFARLLARYGRSDLVKHAGMDELLAEVHGDGPEGQEPEAMRLTHDLEQMGPTFIKLGQLLSTRVDLLPPQLTTLGKTLLNLDQVGRTLDPEFDPNAAIRRHTAELTQHRVRKATSPAAVFSSLLEMNEFVQRLPNRLNRVLDAVAPGSPCSSSSPPRREA